MEKRAEFSIWYLLLTVMAVLWLHSLYVQWRALEPIPYSQFQTLVKEGQVEEISIADNYINGTLKQAHRRDGRNSSLRASIQVWPRILPNSMCSSTAW